MKPNKILSILTALMLMSSIGMVFAQEVSDVGVIAGNTTETIMTTDDTQLHETLGAVVSNIESTWNRFIDFAGLTVYEEEVITQEETFTLYAVPANSNFDAMEIVQGALYESSEDVILTGTTTSNVYDTFNEQIPVGADNQIVAVNGMDVIFDDGSIFNITVYDTDHNFIDYVYNNQTYTNEPGLVDVNDARAIELGFDDKADFVGYISVLYNYSCSGVREKLLPDGNIIFVDWLSDTTGDNVAFGDLNKDGVLELNPETNGFSSASHETQSLAIIPAGTYDIYAILP